MDRIVAISRPLPVGALMIALATLAVSVSGSMGEERGVDGLGAMIIG